MTQASIFARGTTGALSDALKPGVSIERAQADIASLERRIKQQYPSPFQGKDASVMSLQSHIVGEVRAPLLMLVGAVGFLILIVCVNVANEERGSGYEIGN